MQGYCWPSVYNTGPGCTIHVPCTSKQKIFNQCCSNTWSACTTLAQHWTSTGLSHRVCRDPPILLLCSASVCRQIIADAEHCVRPLCVADLTQTQHIHSASTDDLFFITSVFSSFPVVLYRTLESVSCRLFSIFLGFLILHTLPVHTLQGHTYVLLSRTNERIKAKTLASRTCFLLCNSTNNFVFLKSYLLGNWNKYKLVTRGFVCWVMTRWLVSCKNGVH